MWPGCVYCLGVITRDRAEGWYLCTRCACVCGTPTCVSLHLFAVFLISISQHGRFVSLIVSASVLLSRVAADPPPPELQRGCERVSFIARLPVGCLLLRHSLLCLNFNWQGLLCVVSEGMGGKYNRGRSNSR